MHSGSREAGRYSVPVMRISRCLALGSLVCFLALGFKPLVCLWDDDTLKVEAAGFPGLVEVMTGRFDRFPDEYYELRLLRCEERFEARFRDLPLFDNAAVACDRLGRHDEAIAWMERKFFELETPTVPDLEHLYRYHANLGTFHVHRWLAGDRDREEMADVELARDHIAKAIEINPDAHFGRERYQLMAIEWILELPDERTDFLPFASDGFRHGNELARNGYTDAVEGLSGLVVLGAAWNSIDVFHALEQALSDREHAHLAYLAALRIRELLADGRTSLHPGFEPGTPGSLIRDEDQAELEAFYGEARAEADVWRGARNEYVAKRLARGEHPDTHTDFFAEWSDPSAPPAMPSRMISRETSMMLGIGGALALVAGVPIVLLFLAIRFLKNRRRKLATT